MQLITLADVCRQLNISRQTLRILIKSGKFPEPIKLSKSTKSNTKSRWDIEAIKKFLDNKEV